MLTGAGGALAGLAAASMYILRLRQHLRTARFQAGHDDTTGMPNRRTLVAALRRANTGDRLFGLVLLDLDGFKAVNDTYGHELGNDVLADIGARLTDLPAPTRLAARLSGDEFALLVRGSPDEVARAAHLAAAVIAAEPAVLEQGRLRVQVRASVGYTIGRRGVDIRALLREADEAAYRAKADTRTGVCGFHGATAEQAARARSRCRDWL